MSKFSVVLMVLAFVACGTAASRVKRQLLADCFEKPGAYCDYFCKNGYAEDPLLRCGLITSRRCCVPVSTPPPGVTTITPPLGICGVSKYGTETGNPPKDATGRIVGGHDAYPNEFPWQISLQLDSQHICGASIINRLWILTAANCFTGLNPDSPYVKSKFRVVAGEHDLRGGDGTEIYASVSKVIVHKDYNPGNNSHDIALVKLLQPLEFDANAREICLPPSDFDSLPSDLVIVTGWGLLEDGASFMPDILQKVQLVTMSNSHCNEVFPGNVIDDTMLCAQAPQKDSCHGDRGGPLIMQMAEGSQQFVQVGIVSWGDKCAGPTPGVYTRVSHFINWIILTMKNN